MARPKKNFADYYTHDNNMRNHRKILALRAKYKHTGYSVFSMFLEVLTAQNNFKFEIDETELILLSGDFQTEKELVKEILDFCVEIRLLNKENNTYFSQNLIERMSPLLNERERKRLWMESHRGEQTEVKDGNNGIVDGNNGIVLGKVKQSKVTIYGVKTPNIDLTQLKDKPMRTIALNEFGEEMETPPVAVPKKYAGKNKLYSRIAVYYMQLVNKTGNALQFFPALKEIFKLCEKDFPNNSDEDNEKEIKAHINAANSHYQKLNCTDWGLKKVAENWNKISQEWR